MDKKGLRRNIIKKMKSYDKVQKHLADEWLAKKLYQSEAYRKANKIGIVLSMPHEVNTYPIITYSLHNNKKIFVPETNYQQQEMTFKQLLSIEDIEKDGKGIYHSISPVGTTNKMDLIVVPGVAFDKLGYRIGYGGGYYDRFLSQHRSNTVSLLYDFQLAQFNIEPHDQPAEQLIIYHNKVVEE